MIRTSSDKKNLCIDPEPSPDDLTMMSTIILNLNLNLNLNIPADVKNPCTPNSRLKNPCTKIYVGIKITRNISFEQEFITARGHSPYWRQNIIWSRPSHRPKLAASETVAPSGTIKTPIATQPSTNYCHDRVHIWFHNNPETVGDSIVELLMLTPAHKFIQG